MTCLTRVNFTFARLASASLQPITTLLPSTTLDQLTESALIETQR
jgi:hypothetical protein